MCRKTGDCRIIIRKAPIAKHVPAVRGGRQPLGSYVAARACGCPYPHLPRYMRDRYTSPAPTEWLHALASTYTPAYPVVAVLTCHRAPRFVWLWSSNWSPCADLKQAVGAKAESVTRLLLQGECGPANDRPVEGLPVGANWDQRHNRSPYGSERVRGRGRAGGEGFRVSS